MSANMQARKRMSLSCVLDAALTTSPKVSSHHQAFLVSELQLRYWRYSQAYGEEGLKGV